ncbi:MAG: hypothetical protein OEV48_05205 [Acidobacteriota bacterium]|nr:hypothetical protein [Acidobacteriota bacterium]
MRTLSGTDNKPWSRHIAEGSIKNVGVFVALLTGLGGMAAQAEEMPRVASYTIDVTYVAEEPGIEARTDITFVEGSVTPQILTFFLHGELRVDEVRFDGEPVEVTEELVLYPSDYSGVARRTEIEMAGREIPKKLSIHYSGKLNPSAARSPSNYMRVDEDGVFLRSYLYSVWFPVFLEAKQDTYPVDLDVTIRTPEEFRAVATGERSGEKVEEGIRVSRWRSLQDDIFNLQLTARPFELQRVGDIHLYFLGDAESRASAGAILEFSAKLEEFFRANYAGGGEGGQLHVVQMPRYGDISSGNMVGISDRGWRGFESASYPGRTLAHELVHAYVQIPLPRDNELYALVIEGFPSYFHLPAMAAIVGDEYYRQILTRTEDGYLERRRTGLDRRGRTLPPEKPLLDLTVDDISTYKDRFVLNDRARLFCNWLRSQMGVERFGDFTRKLFSQKSLDADHLVEIVETYLPDSADDVNRWLRTEDFPEHFRLDHTVD